MAIWYDEGIEPGSEWPEAIGRALVGASHFIVFISQASVASLNVRNEIGLAADNRKPLLAIHLEKTDLPIGLRLRLNQTQAVFKYALTDAQFEARVRDFLDSGNVLDGELSAGTRATAPRHRVNIPLVAGAFLSMSALVGFFFWNRVPPAKAPDGGASSSPSSTPAASTSIVNGALKLPAGLLHFESDGSPIEKISWFKLNDRKLSGMSPPTEGGSVQWFDKASDGTYRVLVMRAAAGNACSGDYQLMLVGTDGVKTWSNGFGVCQSLERVDAAEGGLDFRFRPGTMARAPRATLRNAVLTNEEGQPVPWANPTLLKYAGRHPSELMDDPELAGRVQRLLGPAIDQFNLSLAVASGTQILNDRLLGSACAPHGCGSHESAVFFGLFSDLLEAAILREGEVSLYVPQGSKPDEFVKTWIDERWKPTRTNIIGR